jgi:hypothetical protein
MAIESPYEITIDLVLNGSAQATTGKFWHCVLHSLMTYIRIILSAGQGQVYHGHMSHMGQTQPSDFSPVTSAFTPKPVAL